VAKAKFNITPQRVAEACNIIEYINLTLKDRGTVMSIAPRFVVDENGEYSMTIKHDEDGDIESMEGYAVALVAMAQTTPKRLEKLINEFCEAARAIVNPPKGEG
jgi:hypothetical protein